MKICYIKRNNMYFSKHLGFNIQLNHWVVDERDAKVYYDGRKAQADIKKYKLKNCTVEYLKLQGVK